MYSIAKFVKNDLGTISDDMSVEELKRQIAISEVGTGFVVNTEGNPIGVIDKSDAVKSFLQENQFLTEQLKWKSLLLSTYKTQIYFFLNILIIPKIKTIIFLKLITFGGCCYGQFSWKSSRNYRSRFRNW